VLRRLEDDRRVPRARLLQGKEAAPTVVARLFNTIGPRQTGQYGMVVPRFVRLALAGEPIPVYGDGTQRRSFTWVRDVVGAMLALIAHPTAHGEVFNIEHTKEISIYELAVLVKEITGSASDIILVPYSMLTRLASRICHAGLQTFQKFGG